MAKENKAAAKGQDKDLEHLKRRLSMLDHRLDDIDSMVSAVIERVMSQPIILNVVCPSCGKSIDISLIGNKRPGA